MASILSEELSPPGLHELADARLADRRVPHHVVVDVGSKRCPYHQRRVQQRRELPTRITQRVQLLIQNNIIKRVLGTRGRMKPPLVVRALGTFPVLQRIPARLIGLGFRREHIVGV